MFTMLGLRLAYEDGREYAMRIGFSGSGTVIRQARSKFAR
jgi:hypothetical protein